MIEWETDGSIALVIIDARGDRAFCAGGDIQILYENGFTSNEKGFHSKFDINFSKNKA